MLSVTLSGMYPCASCIKRHIGLISSKSIQLVFAVTKQLILQLYMGDCRINLL